MFFRSRRQMLFDLLFGNAPVSDRQKHNGMSWTKKGTAALAAITALKQNNEHKKWFEDKDIDFKLAA